MAPRATWSNLSCASIGYPYFIFLLWQFFLGIPIELSDAARIDGCSEFGILVRIILPLARYEYFQRRLLDYGKANRIVWTPASTD